jgi:glycerol-3-phosphate dehydrogenase
MITPIYDVVIVGGGIHGAGVAQAAAAAGYSTLLLERTGLASGTSSRSSKLIHGGLRYLENGQLGLVRESLREREILLRLAPELVRRVPFYIPVYACTRRGPWTIRAGLSLYALLGGLSRETRYETLPRTRWDALDGLGTNGLQAVFCYQDAQTDDAALTRAVMRSAQTLGATLCCPANFLSAKQTQDGFRIHYLEGDKEILCHGKTLVNAAGPWVNTVLDRVAPRSDSLLMELIQGTHILLEGETRNGIYYVEAPRDGRAVFVMPWKGNTLVGTTETPYHGDPAAVQPLPDEVDYLRETFHSYFPARNATPLSSFAGLRVLPHAAQGTFHRARETRLQTDTPRKPRLVSIYGGKLTGYRATAAKVVALLRHNLPSCPMRADTAQLPLTPVE